MTLYRTIDTYLKAKGMAATTFGRIVARDPRLVHDIRKGRVPGPRLRQRIQAHIAGDL